MHIEEEKNECDVPIWETCTESIFEEGPLELTTVKGETRLFTPESDEGFHTAFGEMIASEVLHAIDNGLFATLPLFNAVPFVNNPYCANVNTVGSPTLVTINVPRLKRHIMGLDFPFTSVFTSMHGNSVRLFCRLAFSSSAGWF